MTVAASARTGRDSGRKTCRFRRLRRTFSSPAESSEHAGGGTENGVRLRFSVHGRRAPAAHSKSASSCFAKDFATGPRCEQHRSRSRARHRSHDDGPRAAGGHPREHDGPAPRGPARRRGQRRVRLVLRFALQRRRPLRQPAHLRGLRRRLRRRRRGQERLRALRAPRLAQGAARGRRRDRGQGRADDPGRRRRRRLRGRGRQVRRRQDPEPRRRPRRRRDPRAAARRRRARLRRRLRDGRARRRGRGPARKLRAYFNARLLEH